MPTDNALNNKTNDQKTLDDQSDDSQVIEIAQKVFADVFGKETAIHAKPLFLKNRTLTVTCSSSSMAQGIRMNQKQIVDKINDKLGKIEVDRIRYLA